MCYKRPERECKGKKGECLSLNSGQSRFHLSQAKTTKSKSSGKHAMATAATKIQKPTIPSQGTSARRKIAVQAKPINESAMHVATTIFSGLGNRMSMILQLSCLSLPGKA